MLLKGTADKVFADSLMATSEIFGLEMFAMVAAVVAVGERFGGKGMQLWTKMLQLEH